MPQKDVAGRREGTAMLGAKMEMEDGGCSFAADTTQKRVSENPRRHTTVSASHALTSDGVEDGSHVLSSRVFAKI